MKCATCDNEIPPRIPGLAGRPRTKCFECSPPGENTAYKRQLEDQKQERLRAEQLQNDSRCGCGVDYLTLPFDGGNHLCPRPIPL